MARSLSAIVWFLLALPTTTHSDPIQVEVTFSSVLLGGVDKLVLARTESSPMYLSCETVEIDGSALSLALRKLDNDKALLESTPIRVQLPNSPPVTFLGVNLSVSEVQGRYYIHYFGKTKSEPASMMSRVKVKSGV